MWVSPEEIERLAEFRGRLGREFAAKFVRRGGAPLQPDRKTWRRLHFLGQDRRLHGLSRPAGSMPDLAFLARECRVAGRMGPRSSRSARARATAGFIPWMRSSHRFPGTKMTEGDDSSDDPRQRELDWQRELRELYEELDREVASLGPVCALSGRCCRFLEYGHTLFVSTAEVELLLELAPAPQPARSRGDAAPGRIHAGTARPARPGRSGCRIYYCDPAFEEELHRLSERFIDRLKTLSTKHDIAWNYAPLHRHLHDERRQGRFPPVDAALALENLASNPS